jgi:hemoglobin
MKTRLVVPVLLSVCACAQAVELPGTLAPGKAPTASAAAYPAEPMPSGAAATLKFPAIGTLYQRMGGNDGIAAIVREATRNHLRNPVHKTRFEVIADPARVERMLIEYFSQAAGGPVVYSGKNMVAAHRGMNLSGQEYLAFMDDIVGAMDTLGVSAGTKAELISMMYRIKDHILHK